MMGVSTETVLNWEKDKTRPVASQFRPLVEFLGYDPSLPRAATRGKATTLRRQPLPDRQASPLGCRQFEALPRWHLAHLARPAKRVGGVPQQRGYDARQPAFAKASALTDRPQRLPMHGLGRLPLEAHYHRMMRVCWFSVLIACLAAMAAIGPPALARTAAGSPAQVGSVAAAAPLPSHHRNDCGQAPCALMAGYTAACPASAPILSDPAVDLPSAAAEHRYWPLGLAELAGRRPLPNPFPPKR